jgi:CHAD domain-containing protein
MALEQIDRAKKELGAHKTGRSAVHETRKCLKRVRALLRLLRPGLGDTAFRELNAELRDIAALLAPARDREILLETIAKLEQSAAKPTTAALAAVKPMIESQRRAGARTSAESVNEALRRLEVVSRPLSKLTLEPADFTSIERGLRTSFRKARKAFSDAYRDGTSEAFHEWRKLVQRHWRHMQLLSRAWPEHMEARVEAARHLSQLLGDDHDLSVLAAFVDGLPRETLGATQAQEIRRAITKRQTELRQGAAPRGAMLFSGRARSFARELRTMWESAQRLGKIDSAPPRQKQTPKPPRRRREPVPLAMKPARKTPHKYDSAARISAAVPMGTEIPSAEAAPESLLPAGASEQATSAGLADKAGRQ